MELRGASALVTGAGRGIGRAIALALGRAGASVTAVARTASDLESLASEIQRAGGRTASYAGDVRDPAVCAGAIARAREAHGRLQILVNNAGVGAHAPVAETTDDQWQRILDTNLTAVFRLTRAALPDLTQGGGHVFMISSLAAVNPIAGMAAYCASKAALDHFAGFGGESRSGDASWMLHGDDIAAAVLDLLRTRDDALLSRVEMRPLRPARRP